MADAISWTVAPDPEELHRRWAEAPDRAKNAIRYNFGRYLTYLIQYIKKNKLSGQVLGKYQPREGGAGAYSTIGGRAMYSQGRTQWTKPRGTMVSKLVSETRLDPEKMEATVASTVYGVAWEHGFSRRAFTVSAKHLTRDGGMGYLMFWAGGGWRYAHDVHVPAARFDARPWAQPSVEETYPQLRSMVVRPLINLFSGAFSKVRQVGEG